jgi:NAD(P)-dependent dehydrogenase (short-subunit alcohol dehydrogenase family)
MPNKRFANKVAVITGAASGIGAATARLLWQEGAHVVLADIGDEGGKSLAASLGPSAMAVKCDVSKAAEVEALIKAAVAAHGRIDILFNNAGIGSFGTSVELAPADWENIIAVDLNSVYYACHFAIPHMPAGSAIVNTASISGMGGDYRFRRLQRRQGRRHQLHPRARHRPRPRRHPRQRALPRPCRYADHGRCLADARPERGMDKAHPARPRRAAGGDGESGRLPRLG